MRNRYFVGRKDLLARLLQAVTDDDGPVRQALHGFGGVGKTQITTEYAHRYQTHYDLVWWIPADQVALVRSSLAALGPRMGLAGAGLTGIEEAAATVLDALRRGSPYRRWLLIFDNADQPEDIADVLPDGQGHVLITTRNQQWEAVVDTIAVDVFTRAESLEFLARRVRGIASTSADRLAEALGDLPLALEQAGALQTETGMSVDDYLALLRDSAGLLLAESKPKEYPVSMTGAWSLAMARLKQQQPDVVELLYCLAFFGPEPVPRDALAAGGGAVEDSLGWILADPIRLSRAIRGLGRYALARIDYSPRTLHVHRLVQALLRDELPSDERSQKRHDVHAILTAYASSDPYDVANWPTYAAAHPHAVASEITTCGDQSVWQFTTRLAGFLYISGRYEAACGLAGQFTGQWTAKGEQDHPATLAMSGYLGATLHAQGRYRESCELNHDLFDRTRAVLGRDHELALAVAVAYGADLRARGDFGGAFRLDEETVARYRAVFGEADARTLAALDSLALDYALAGDLVRARRLHEDICGTRPAAQSNIPSSVATLTNLSRTVRLCGEYKTACGFAEEGLQTAKALLGEEHPVTLRAAKELSIGQRQAGAFPAALELGRSVLAAYRKVFGPDHPDTLAATVGLANTCRSAGQLDEAFDLASDSLERYPRAYGPGHPYYYGCAANLAVLHRLRRDPAAARNLSESSLVGLESSFGSHHYYSLFCAVNLASDFAALGEKERAADLGAQTLDRLQQALGDDHPITLGCAVNLEHDLRALSGDKAVGGLAAAAKVRGSYTDVSARYYEVVGAEHPSAQLAAAGGRIDVDFDPFPG